MSAATCWRPDRPDDGMPVFGRKAKAWLRRRIRAEFFIATPDPDTFIERDGGGEWAARAVDVLLGFFMAEPLKYVTWVDADDYRGPGFSFGCWSYKGLTVESAKQAAIDHTDRLLDAEQHPTLDDWLRADIAGELYYAGAPSGMARVPASVRRAVERVRCACGLRFKPERRNAKRCPACRENAHMDAAKRADRRRGAP